MPGFKALVGTITYKGHKFNSLEELYDWVLQNPQERDEVYNSLPYEARGYWDTLDLYHQFQDGGDVSANEVLQSAGQNGVELDPTLEKSLDNLVARENTANDQQYQEHMRDTAISSTGNQLEALGLSRSGVIQVGGATSGVSSAAASNNMHSAASLYQRERINNFNQNLGIAKSIMSLVGSMASSGIYGHAIGAAKQAGSALAAATAHSGIKAMSALNQGKFRKDVFGKYPKDKVGGFYSIFE